MPGRGQTYYQTWLRRTRRRLAASGSVSQAALRLAREDGDGEVAWRERLTALLDDRLVPDPEWITRIDAVLATPAAESSPNPAQELLFPEEE